MPRLHSPLLLSLLLTLAFVTTSFGQDSTETDRQDIQSVHDFRVQLVEAFWQENWTELQTLANTAATQKQRFPGGAWKLSIFYTTLMSPGSLTATDDRWTSHLAKLQRWTNAMPGSAVPRIALARAYEDYAWKARGHGWANTVTAEGLKNFNNRLELARAILTQCRSYADVNVEWFHAMEIVALGQSWAKEDAAHLFQSAIAFEPGYTPIYTKRIEYLLPRWYGKPGDASEFLTTAANNLGGDEGDFLYFWEVVTYRRSLNDLPNLSWDRVKRGFAATESAYTSNNFERNAMAYLAVQYGDREFAKSMFVRIGSDWDEQIWRSKPAYDSAKAQAPAPTTANQ